MVVAHELAEPAAVETTMKKAARDVFVFDPTEDRWDSKAIGDTPRSWPPWCPQVTLRFD